jgi:site-specific DNA recombinase
LNEEGAAAPRPQQNRPAGWAPTTVRDVLHRPIYRGEVVWNQTRKRDRWGQHRQAPRPDAEWLRQEHPELRIVSDALWTAAHSRLKGIRAHLASMGSRLAVRHARDVDSKYLLTGFARCTCGASFSALSRHHGTQRVFFYGCLAHYKRGRTVCDNGMVKRMDLIDEAVSRTLLRMLGGDVLRPAVTNAVIEGVLEAMSPKSMAVGLDRQRAELGTVEREIARLTEAIATGGNDLPTVIAALKARQARQDDLQRAIAASAVTHVSRINRRALERQVRERLTRWTSMLTGHVEEGRALFREMLVGPIKFTPEGDHYRFEGVAAMDRLFAGVAGVTPFVASPTGFEPVFWP